MSPRRRGAPRPRVPDGSRAPFVRGGLTLVLGVALLVAIGFLLHEPQEVRYGRSHGTSLRALLDRAEVAVLAELTSEDSPWIPHVASYRVEHVVKGPLQVGDALRVTGPHRLPYHGRHDGWWMGAPEFYEARPGHRVFLFVRRAPDDDGFTVVDPSGALHVGRLHGDWRADRAAVAEAFLEDLLELARIQDQPSGRWLSRERDWLLDGLEDPLTSGRAAGDLLLNWRSRPRLVDDVASWADAGDARAQLGAVELGRLLTVLGDRRHIQSVRDDVAWLLADEPDPAVDDVLTLELTDRLAVAAFDPDVAREDRRDASVPFPADFSPEFAVHHSERLLAVLAHRARDPELDRRREAFASARLDQDEVVAYRRFTDRWLELWTAPTADAR